jgi:pyrroline-5-carboxylate reductase
MSSAALPQPAESESESDDPSLTLDDRIGFIGAGAMGEALIRGFCASGISSADRLSASVRSSERQKKMTSLGVRVFQDATRGGAKELASNNDIIVLGVKPIFMKGILAALAPHLEERHLVVSIAAGLTIETLEAALPDGARVVRVMPNTPCLIGEAASTYVMGTHAREEDQEKVDALMSSVGMAVRIDEWQMDAATGLAGSGPAYVFQMLEAMSDGAVAAGLTRDKAQALAAQTLIGAARMVFESSGDGTMTHPAVLKDRVTSPGGTTITGLAELESSGVRGAYIRAIQAAARRSKELSQQ